MSKTLQRKLKAKIPNSFQGPEWDSSDEEDSELVKKRSPVEKKVTKQHSSKNESTKKGIKYDKKTSGGDNENEENDLALYIGHLPKEFEELDLRRFLSQFGKVYNCRVARKIETGNPKGFAFVRFADDEVTQIACDTLHGYFLDKQRLVCQVRTSHPGMFFDTDKMIDRRRKKLQLETKQRNGNLANSAKLKTITSRLVIRELKKREKLKALGIDYDFPGYKSNRTEFEEQFVPEETIDTAEVDEEDIAGVDDNHSSPSKGTELNDGNGSAKKKMRRKDSFDNQGTASDKKKRRKNSIDKNEHIDNKHERLTKPVKKEKKKKNKRRSAP